MSHKSITKTLTAIFASLVILQTFGFLLFFAVENKPAEAAISFKPQVPIPGMKLKDGVLTIDNSSIGQYIETVYNYAIGSVGILATAAIIFGGILWITAGGNTSRVETAKTTISAALTGMILALSSYFILNTINPDLLSFEPLSISNIAETSTQTCCQWSNECADGYQPKQCELKISGIEKKEGTFLSNHFCFKDNNICLPLSQNGEICTQRTKPCANGLACIKISDSEQRCTDNKLGSYCTDNYKDFISKTCDKNEVSKCPNDRTFFSTANIACDSATSKCICD